MAAEADCRTSSGDAAKSRRVVRSPVPSHAANHRQNERSMMEGMGGMMWAAGLLWLLLIIVLVLAAAALIKYLRSDRTK